MGQWPFPVGSLGMITVFWRLGSSISAGLGAREQFQGRFMKTEMLPLWIYDMQLIGKSMCACV